MVNCGDMMQYTAGTWHSTLQGLGTVHFRDISQCTGGTMHWWDSALVGQCTGNIVHWWDSALVI